MDFISKKKDVENCANELIILIENDIETVDSILRTLDDKNISEKEQERLFLEIMFYTCKAALPIKGLEDDSLSREEVFELFLDYFVLDGIFLEKFRDLIILAKMGLGLQLIANKEEVFEFIDYLKIVYNSLDDNLLFSQLDIDDELQQLKNFRDLRGVKCPLNYLKTRIALSKLEKNEFLTVLIDDGEPFENVPKSLANDGFEIVSKIKEQDYCEVIIKNIIKK